MAQAEMQLWMTHDKGLAVRAVVEYGIGSDALLLEQCLLQQQVGSHAEALSLFELILQGLLATLGADGVEGLLEVELAYFVVNIHHEGAKLLFFFVK